MVRTPKRKSKIVPDDMKCRTCGDELSVYWKRRVWCCVCDDEQIFTTACAPDLFTDAYSDGGGA